jgi:hypothetical protein
MRKHPEEWISSYWENPEFNGSSKGILCSEKGLQYNTNWNWIMEVVDKIRDIKLEVKEYRVLEWFEVHLYSNGCLIKSGLNHADGETKSPYHYSNSVWKSSGKEAVVHAIWEFLNWYKDNK